MTNYYPRFAISIAVALISITAASCAATPEPVAAAEPTRPAGIPRVAAPEKLKPNTDALQWRFIGPITGNRGSAVVGHPTDKNVFYFGASSGLWKTPDAGLTWVPLGDGQFKSGHVGAVEISESHPDVIYDDITHTMDIARISSTGKIMFDEVAFVPGVLE